MPSTAQQPLLTASQLRKFSTGTFKTLGFFTWGLSCAWLFQEYAYDWGSSTGPSMYPTLSATTKYNIISKRHRLGRNLRVGDLVIAKHPNFRNVNIGKRVLGLPGDFVVRDPHMSRTVGGMPVGSSATTATSSSSVEGAEAGEGEGVEVGRAEPEMIEVPPGHVWLAGDNMAWSRDSRFHGPVPMGLILGKIVRHSDPRSDWMVDMVDSGGDQLRPAGLGMDEWTLNRELLRREMREKGLLEDGELELREKA